MKKTTIAALLTLITQTPASAGPLGCTVVAVTCQTAETPPGSRPLFPLSTTAPLTGMPSANGAHIASIQSMAGNTYLQLPDAAADPIYGIPNGRSWAGRGWTYASSVRGAFLAGPGPHNFIRPDNYDDRDIWMYDIPANRWIAVKPGNDLTNFNARVAAGCIKMDLDKVTPVTYDNQAYYVGGMPVHAWGYTFFDAGRNRYNYYSPYAHINTFFLAGTTAFTPNSTYKIDSGIAALQAQVTGLPVPQMGPYYFDLNTQRLEVDKLSVPFSLAEDYHQWFSLPTGKYLLIWRSGTAEYDPDTRAFTLLNTTGPRPTGSEPGSVHDTLRNRVLISGGLLFPNPATPTVYDPVEIKQPYVYDIATKTFSRPTTTGGGPDNLGSSSSVWTYDTANDVYIVQRTNVTWALNPTTWVWTQKAAFPSDAQHDPLITARMGFYDPQLNRHIYLSVLDGGFQPRRIFAYRYQ
jgi:hypothetical protein